MKRLLAIAVLLCGCSKPSYLPQICVAIGVSSAGRPTPAPPPAKECANCGGTGWLGDGKPRGPCPECNADEHIPKPAKESPKQITIVVKKQDTIPAAEALPSTSAARVSGSAQGGAARSNYVWRQVPVRTCNRYGGCTTFYQWQLVPAR